MCYEQLAFLFVGLFNFGGYAFGIWIWAYNLLKKHVLLWDFVFFMMYFLQY